MALSLRPLSSAPGLQIGKSRQNLPNLSILEAALWRAVCFNYSRTCKRLWMGGAVPLPVNDSSSLRASQSQSSNLDFLRAVAVLSVYVFHLLYTVGVSHDQNPGRPDLGWFLGRFGVLVFFVHTSLVLMMSLERLEFSNRSLFRSFYIRRFFRIYPLSMVCVAIVVLFHLPQSPHVAWFNPDRYTILANFLLVTSLFYKANVISVLWTLPLEVQMYLLLPIVYLIGRRYRLPGIAFLWIAGVVGAYIQPHIAGRLIIAAYIPCFMAGVASYFASFVLPRRLPFIGWPITIAAAAGLFLGFGSGDRFEVAWIMCLMIGLSAPLFKELKFTPLKKASEWVARYSYGIYLTHMYAMWAALIVLESRPLWIRLSVLIALSAGLPVLFYECLESPMVKLGSRLANRLPVLKAAGEPANRLSAGSGSLFPRRTLDAPKTEEPANSTPVVYD
jgi:peptidoglycan/LPS O-acetylase OafA/YrhL